VTTKTDSFNFFVVTSKYHLAWHWYRCKSK